MFKLSLKWSGLFILDIAVLVLNYIVVAWALSLFTKAQPDLNEKTKPWGGWFGTWDNPPQGDSRWLRLGWFPGKTTGIKGYLNRVGWLFRNPGYGFQRWAAVNYSDRNKLIAKGNPDISDKYKIPGSYLAKLYDKNSKLIAFEYYLVKPWSDTKCIRIRFGWKLVTDKFETYGFAAYVNTFNPFKSYGKQ